MCYLHSLDILHGDLTGGNILLISSNKDLRGFIAKARSPQRLHLKSELAATVHRCLGHMHA